MTAKAPPGDGPAAVGPAPADAHPEGPGLRGWWLYLIACGDGTWYAGIAVDVQARLAAHASGRGARYTRGRGPFQLLACRTYPDRAAASRAEWQLKQLPRARKLAFFAGVQQGPGASSLA